MTLEHPPNVSSFLIADQVFQQKSGKWCIVGVFNKIYCQAFPVFHPSMGLYAIIGDAKGEYRIRIDFCNSKGDVVTSLAGITIQVPNRLTTGEFGIQAFGLPIPEPGKYFFRLYFNDVPAPIDFALEAELIGVPPK